MNPIQVQFSITLGREAMASLEELLSLAIKKGTAELAAAVLRPTEPHSPRRESTAMTTIASTVASKPAAPTGERQLPSDEAILLDTKEVAKLLGLGERTIWRLSHSGRMPAPLKIGGAVRWYRAAIESWIEDGCPVVERRGVRRP